MKDLILALTMLAMVAFGWLVMRRLDAFLEENQRRIEKERLHEPALFRLAAENPMLLGAVAPSLAAQPGVELAVTSGRGERLLHRLEDGTVDLVVLSVGAAPAPECGFGCLLIPYRRQGASAQVLGLPVAAPEEAMVCVLWNPAVACPVRDDLLHALAGSQKSAAGK